MAAFCDGRGLGARREGPARGQGNAGHLNPVRDLRFEPCRKAGRDGAGEGDKIQGPEGLLSPCPLLYPLLARANKVLCSLSLLEGYNRTTIPPEGGVSSSVPFTGASSI